MYVGFGSDFPVPHRSLQHQGRSITPNTVENIAGFPDVGKGGSALPTRTPAAAVCYPIFTPLPPFAALAGQIHSRHSKERVA